MDTTDKQTVTKEQLIELFNDEDFKANETTACQIFDLAVAPLQKELSNVRTIKNEIAKTAKEYMDANDSLQKELSEARGRIERLEALLREAQEYIPIVLDGFVVMPSVSLKNRITAALPEPPKI